MFIFKQSIGMLQVTISFLCSVVVCVFITKDLKKTKLIVLLGVLFFVLSIFLCNILHDMSYDGNTYHKSIAGLMKNGWNPIYMTFYDFAKEYYPFINRKETWYDAYPKGSEIYGACIYAITGNIESGKSYNLISSLSVLCMGYGFLRNIGSLKVWQVKVCSFFFAFNPVVLSQMFTYYNDGFMWNIILICIMACLNLTFSNNTGKEQLICFGVIFSAINIAFNIKFSAMIFLALPCISIFAYWWINKGKYERSFVYRSFIVFVLSVISAFIISVSSLT